MGGPGHKAPARLGVGRPGDLQETNTQAHADDECPPEED